MTGATVVESALLNLCWTVVLVLALVRESTVAETLSISVLTSAAVWIVSVCLAISVAASSLAVVCLSA